jgi:hypothetical protein
MSARIVAVVVAYNRRELLLEVLQALAHQTLAPDVVVVVDNASTDGTSDAVRRTWTSSDWSETRAVPVVSPSVLHRRWSSTGPTWYG